jgi:predicted ATPase
LELLTPRRRRTTSPEPAGSLAGSFSLSGVEAVITSAATSVLDVMDSLVEQSLVMASVDTGRYRLLETVRLYALDRLLNADQLAATRRPAPLLDRRTLGA